MVPAGIPGIATRNGCAVAETITCWDQKKSWPSPRPDPSQAVFLKNSRVTEVPVVLKTLALTVVVPLSRAA
jgi:hypothetical protein